MQQKRNEHHILSKPVPAIPRDFEEKFLMQNNNNKSSTALATSISKQNLPVVFSPKNPLPRPPNKDNNNNNTSNSTTSPNYKQQHYAVMTMQHRPLSSASFVSSSSGNNNNNSRTRSPVASIPQQSHQSQQQQPADLPHMSVAEETRQFARRQLAEFRAAEEHRTTAYRQLRSGLRNIETIIQDIPLSDQLAKDVREKAPTEQMIHLQIVTTSMHRKITELSELLEESLKTEAAMRRRMELAEARAASAENKVIDLQAKLFEAELKNLHGNNEHTGMRLGRAAALGRR